MKKLILILLLLLVSCSSNYTSKNTYDKNSDIVVLFTSNMNKSNLTYDDVIEIKNDYLNKTPNLTLVNLGNFIKEDTDFSSLNKTNYDYSCLDLNEFNFGLDRLYENINKCNSRILLGDIAYNGQKRDVFKKTRPYEIVDYDGIKVGYLGLSSPNISTLLSEDKYFENDNSVLNFFNEVEEVFYDTVQSTVNKMKKEGASYVIVFSCFGDDESLSPYNAFDILENTCDIDVFIDGSFNASYNDTLINSDGKDTLLVSNGLNDYNIGALTLKDGDFASIYIK